MLASRRRLQKELHGLTANDELLALIPAGACYLSFYLQQHGASTFMLWNTLHSPLLIATFHAFMHSTERSRDSGMACSSCCLRSCPLSIPFTIASTLTPQDGCASKPLTLACLLSLHIVIFRVRERSSRPKDRLSSCYHLKEQATKLLFNLYSLAQIHADHYAYVCGGEQLLGESDGI